MQGGFSTASVVVFGQGATAPFVFHPNIQKKTVLRCMYIKIVT